MCSQLKSKAEIASAQCELEAAIRQSFKGKATTNIRHPGGSDQLVEVLEVKSSVDRQSVFTAIGQLFVHGDTPNCKHVMALPGKDQLATDLAQALQRNGIDLMRYDLTETAVLIR